MIVRLAIFITILSLPLVNVARPALAQGFFFGPGYGAAFGVRGTVAPGWQSGPWGGGFGVAPSRIELSIGVPPSFPHRIGVPSGHFGPAPFPHHGHVPFVGGFPDYRSLYTLRVLQSHQAQMEFAAGLERMLPLPVQPLHQDEVYRRFGSDGTMGRDLHSLPQSPLGFSADENGLAGQADQRDLGTAWPVVTTDDLNAILAQMVQSARRLDQSLARRGEEGDVWRQYLSTDLIAAADQHPLADSEWIKVLQNFDGVVANGDLRWVMRSDGFAETRQWISAWVDGKATVRKDSEALKNDGSASPAPPRVGPPAPPKPNRNRAPDFEVLPAPQRARL
jgi:hypothetical protein